MQANAEAPSHSPAPRVPRRSKTARSRVPPLLLAVVLAVGTASAVVGDDAPVAPSEAPVVLSNAHVGMSAAQISAGPPANEAAPQAQPSAEVTALQTQADALAKIAAAKVATAEQLAAQAKAASRALAAVGAGLVPGVGSNEDGPASYERCMEAMIRRGDSLGSSDSLCRFVFPNAPKPK